MEHTLTIKMISRKKSVVSFLVIIMYLCVLYVMQHYSPGTMCANTVYKEYVCLAQYHNTSHSLPTRLWGDNRIQPPNVTPYYQVFNFGVVLHK